MFTPTKPATPAPSPAPWDSRFEQTKASLISNRDTALTNLANDKTRLQSTYGYNMDGTENTSDPYSRLAQLRADYEKIKRGSSVSYAARGQLYSGAYQNQVNADQEAQNRSLDSLRKDFADQSAGIRNQETGIWGEFNSGYTDASNARIDSAANAVATGEAPVATAKTRKDSVLAALSTPKKWKPGHLKNLLKEAKQNGWI